MGDLQEAAAEAVSSGPSIHTPYRLLADVDFASGVVVGSFTNLHGCRIGTQTRISPFVEIQHSAVVGAWCKLSSHAFVCEGGSIEDEVFTGHGVRLVNDKRPRATNPEGQLQGLAERTLLRTVVEQGTSLGSRAVVRSGVRIGAGALVGAGAVVTSEVPAEATVAGVPAREMASRGTRS